MTDRPKTRRKEPIGLRVRLVAPWQGEDRGVLAYVPATGSDAERLKPLHHKEGDLVFADFRKPRNPGFHRLAHAIGTLAVENIDGFAHLSAHEALKRLQMESGCGCETVMVNMNTIWQDVLGWIKENLGEAFVTILRMGIKEAGIRVKLVPLHVPRSLAYDSLDQQEFYEVIKGICKFMAIKYWPGCSAEQIQEMAEAAGRMADET